MVGKIISMRTLLYICSIFHKRLIKRTGFQNRSNLDCNTNTFNLKFHKYPSLNLRSISEFSKQTLVFDVEGALLKSSSLFPYFMIVAFEAGGLIRALILLLLYPLIWLVNQNIGIKIMVMVSFFGIKQEGFRVGRAVLPKFFLEDVGFDGFEVLMRYERKMGVSELPTVMIEGFLKEYLGVDFVVGRELKVFHGYYLGLMEEKKGRLDLQETLLGKFLGSDTIVGFGSFQKSLEDYHFSLKAKIPKAISIP